MGTDKALLTYRGRAFLETILTTLREAGLSRITVVLGHHASEIQRAVDLGGAEVVINRDYHQGQTSSLQAGLKALEGTEPEAIVLCLVDHPAISAETVRVLLATFRQSGSPVVIPTYRGQRGHPVLMGRVLFAELKTLSHGEGANTVVRKYRQATQFVEVQDPGIVVDVDDPETYGQLT